MPLRYFLYFSFRAWSIKVVLPTPRCPSIAIHLLSMVWSYKYRFVFEGDFANYFLFGKKLSSPWIAWYSVKCILRHIHFMSNALLGYTIRTMIIPSTYPSSKTPIILKRPLPPKANTDCDCLNILMVKSLCLSIFPSIFFC